MCKGAIKQSSMSTAVERHSAFPPCNTMFRERVLQETTGPLCEAYSLGQVLGKGASGVVRLAEDADDGKLFACKTIPVDFMHPDGVPSLQAEIAAMDLVAGHPNIVELHDLFEETHVIHLIMDLCTGGDLFDYLDGKKLAEADIAFIYWQAAEALRYCHSNGLIHRDVKPENFMVAKKIRDSDGKIRPLLKLIDFGHAVVLGEGEAATGPAGSPMYVAPEVAENRPHGAAADMFSLGVSLFTSLSGHMPFKVASNVASQVTHSPVYHAKTWAKISPEAKELVRSLLQVDPRLRPTAEEVLEHPWIQQHCANMPFALFPSDKDTPRGRSRGVHAEMARAASDASMITSPAMRQLYPGQETSMTSFNLETDDEDSFATDMYPPLCSDSPQFCANCPPSSPIVSDEIPLCEIASDEEKTSSPSHEDSFEDIPLRLSSEVERKSVFESEQQRATREMRYSGGRRLRPLCSPKFPDALVLPHLSHRSSTSSSSTMSTPSPSMSSPSHRLMLFSPGSPSTPTSMPSPHSNLRSKSSRKQWWVSRLMA
eukprot:TRINITY_DN21_c0_g2_i1.p1 TRINITY_DN21_c0_g2~~TRINITY_DN21_c0_g2_i1.p1  ORF type:complete len:541 (+),score=68.18 TRINITY_DN21_c0_g2_i1:171-1793(+)